MRYVSIVPLIMGAVYPLYMKYIMNRALTSVDDLTATIKYHSRSITGYGTFKGKVGTAKS